MSVDEKILLCDRELEINYFVKSPLRYACHRVFSSISNSPTAPKHRTLRMDVIDRPRGGVDFQGGKVLLEGALWRLAEKGEYLYLHISSPSAGRNGMDAVFARRLDHVKVFLDTPWAGQTGFSQGWNLLLQAVFRASLDASCEQLVNGLGLKVGERGFLVKVLSPNPSEIIDVLTGRFPSVGENRMLLRREDEQLLLYATPWTRNGHNYRLDDARLEKLILIKSQGSESLSVHQMRLFFASSREELAMASGGNANRSPIEFLPTVQLHIASLDSLPGDLERLASN